MALATPTPTANGWKHIESLPSGYSSPTVFTTGHDEAGKSIIQSKRPSEWVSIKGDRYAVSVINTTKGFPVDMTGDADIKSHAELMANGSLGLVRKNGIVCRMLDFSPLTKHPMMHRTQSFDYGIILEGSMVMDLDDGSSTVMKKGDVMIQRGTMHAWRNPSSTDWARVLFILIDSAPLAGPDGKGLEEDIGTGGEWPPST